MSKLHLKGRNVGRKETKKEQDTAAFPFGEEG